MRCDHIALPLLAAGLAFALWGVASLGRVTDALAVEMIRADALISAADHQQADAESGLSYAPGRDCRDEAGLRFCVQVPGGRP